MIHTMDVEEILCQLDTELAKRKVASSFDLDTCHQRISALFCTLIDLLGYEEGSHTFFTHYNAIIPPMQDQRLPADGMSCTCTAAHRDHVGVHAHHDKKWYLRIWNRY
jgi:hypothetical protein